VNSLEFRLLDEVVHVLVFADNFLIGRLRATDLLHIRNEFGVQRTATKRRIVEAIREVNAALKVDILLLHEEIDVCNSNWCSRSRSQAYRLHLDIAVKKL